MVFKGHGKGGQDGTTNTCSKMTGNKFISKPRSTNSQYNVSTNSSAAGLEQSTITEKDVQVTK